MKPKINVTYYPIESDILNEYIWPAVNPTLVSFIVHNLGLVLKELNDGWYQQYLEELADEDDVNLYSWWTIEVYENNYFTIVYDLSDIGFNFTMINNTDVPEDDWVYVGTENNMKFYLYY